MGDRGNAERGTYTWFSPFGDRNQDATERATMTMRPTKIE
jgi:hypothetical protein